MNPLWLWSAITYVDWLLCKVSFQGKPTFVSFRSHSTFPTKVTYWLVGHFCGKKELRDWGSLLIQMIILGLITAIVIGTTGFADDNIGTLDARVDGCPNIRSSSYSTTTRTTSRWRHSALGPGPLHCFCIVPHLWLANDNLRETLKSFGHLFQNVITRIVVGISWVPCQRYLGCAQEESE